MLFSSTVFLLVFLVVVLLVYHLPLRGRRSAQNIFLLLASLFFYAWGKPSFLPVMLLSIAMNYGFGLWVHRWRSQCRYLTVPVTVTVVCNLGLLFIYKYLNFTVASLNALGLDLTVPGIELPIGISFFTFQALSYVLDVAMGKAKVQRSPLALGLYISFFPQLIAGPIVKYTTVERQILFRQENWTDFSAGCARFLTGLGKKVLLSNHLAVVVDAAWERVGAGLSPAFAWLGSVCYILQLYYDFSGYSDMAIGLGKMFGFHFLENFDHPYASTSVSDFWRRWHISLTSWFRDYVYIPLGGSRAGKLKQYRNLLIVWLLTGLWHGANWTFVFWGLFSLACVYLDKLMQVRSRWPKPLGWLFTMFTFNLGCVIFRAPDLSGAGQFLLTMFGQAGNLGSDPRCGLYLRENLLILLFAILFSFPLAEKLRDKVDGLRGRRYDVTPLLDLLYALGLTAVAVLSVAYLVKETYNPFIYFQF